MKGTFALFDIAGYVALLLWGTHMVTSGVLRGYGSALRHWLGRYLSQRAAAFCFGLGMTALLQSSTATGKMATSFATNGFLGLVPGLVVMLGANVGTTLVVQLLSFDIALVAPVLVLLGFVVYRRSDLRAAQQLVVHKEVLWRLENEISERHIRALRERRDDGGAGDVYLRILRDLKRIHSHLVPLAYTVLERAGLLQDRLRAPAPAGAAR